MMYVKLLEQEDLVVLNGNVEVKTRHLKDLLDLLSNVINDDYYVDTSNRKSLNEVIKYGRTLYGIPT